MSCEPFKLHLRNIVPLVSLNSLCLKVTLEVAVTLFPYRAGAMCLDLYLNGKW